MDLIKRGKRWVRKEDGRFATNAEIAAFTGKDSKTKTKTKSKSSGGGGGGSLRGCMLGTETMTRVKVEDGWDILDGLLFALKANGVITAPFSGVHAEAQALYRRAHPDDTEDKKDTAQHELGRQLAQILGSVAVFNGWNAQTWIDAMPRELRLVTAASTTGGAAGGGGFVDAAAGADDSQLGETLGAVAGGVLGSYLGPAGTAAGAAIGGAIGGGVEDWARSPGPVEETEQQRQAELIRLGQQTMPFYDSAATSASGAP